MSEKKNNQAIVLLSGGLDSTTLLYDCLNRGFQAHCLIFSYGQRHNKEIKKAEIIAQNAGCAYEIVKISLPWQGSSLLDKRMAIPDHEEINPQNIPTTYVPARNIIFLSFAASFAEAAGAKGIFIGANAIDYSGYPDCRPEFFKAYQAMMRQGLKTGVQGQSIKVFAPFVRKTKKQIIRHGLKLNVPYHLTWSCYEGKQKPCGVCDSCRLRAKGFEEAGATDPALST